ncbi:hypothetical protein CRM22_000134 [Opisthorchis felineus]|uniref:Uncharacterized protein n=1 Tax=Opisthorchis felineus TaxID=147828 RepID=A0A4S2MGU9_OPIFE|nr:hypothetical protein CRM22_000134 [Opisthorchis felineus]
MEQTSETHDTPDKDNQIWTNFESQLDNIFLVLSSTNASADSDTSESRHGINDRHMASLLEACRDLDSWFVKKRFLLSSQRPDLLLQEVRFNFAAYLANSTGTGCYALGNCQEGKTDSRNQS